MFKVSWPLSCSRLLKKMGQNFIDIQYIHMDKISFALCTNFIIHVTGRVIYTTQGHWSPLSTILNLSTSHLFLSPAAGGGSGNFRQKIPRERERKLSRAGRETHRRRARFQASRDNFRKLRLAYICRNNLLQNVSLIIQLWPNIPSAFWSKLGTGPH